jgi:ABC-2 type transport system permease protein
LSLRSTTLRHDGLALLRERGAWLLMGVLVIASLLAISGGQRELGRMQSLQQQLVLQVDDARREAGDQAMRLAREGGAVSQFRDPRIADVVGRRLVIEQALLPPTPLLPLSTGQAGLVSAQQPVSLESRAVLLSEGELTPPRRLATGSLDISFVVVFLAPLLVIALGHGVPSWERQHGLLRLLLMQQPRLNGWIALRHGIRFAVVLSPLLLAGLAVTLLNGAGVAGLVRLVAWSLVVALYLGFWAVLVSAVAARSRGADQSLLVLAGCWLLLVVVLPSTINAVVELRYPVPQRIVYVDALRDATDEARAQGSQILADYLEDHPEMAAGSVDPRNFFAQRFVVQQRVEAGMQPLAADFREQREARLRSLRWLRFLSPAILAAEGLEEAAGTGDGRYRHFDQQVEVFHQHWREFFEPYVLSSRPFAAHDEIPRFVYREETMRQMASRLMPVLLGLLLLTSLAGLAARREVRRMC